MVLTNKLQKLKPPSKLDHDVTPVWRLALRLRLRHRQAAELGKFGTQGFMEANEEENGRVGERDPGQRLCRGEDSSVVIVTIGHRRTEQWHKEQPPPLTVREEEEEVRFCIGRGSRDLISKRVYSCCLFDGFGLVSLKSSLFFLRLKIRLIFCCIIVFGRVEVWSRRCTDQLGGGAFVGFDSWESWRQRFGSAWMERALPQVLTQINAHKFMYVDTVIWGQSTTYNRIQILCVTFCISSYFLPITIFYVLISLSLYNN